MSSECFIPLFRFNTCEGGRGVRSRKQRMQRDGGAVISPIGKVRCYTQWILELGLSPSPQMVCVGCVGVSLLFLCVKDALSMQTAGVDTIPNTK